MSPLKDKKLESIGRPMNSAVAKFADYFAALPLTEQRKRSGWREMTHVNAGFLAKGEGILPRHHPVLASLEGCAMA